MNTTLVVVSRLPAAPATLWLRLLGRGKVQRRAMDELSELPEAHPLRQETERRALRGGQKLPNGPTCPKPTRG